MTSAAGVDSDGHHPTEKASAVRQYLQNAKVIGGRRKTSRTTRTEMDRRHSDVVRPRCSKSNDDDRGQRELKEIRGSPSPTVHADPHESEEGEECCHLSVSGKSESVNERTHTDQPKIHILGVCRRLGNYS